MNTYYNNKGEENIAFDNLINAITDIFKADNSDFDRVKFYGYCYKVYDDVQIEEVKS